MKVLSQFQMDYINARIIIVPSLSFLRFKSPADSCVRNAASLIIPPFFPETYFRFLRFGAGHLRLIIFSKRIPPDSSHRSSGKVQPVLCRS